MSKVVKEDHKLITYIVIFSRLVKCHHLQLTNCYWKTKSKIYFLFIMWGLWWVANESLHVFTSNCGAPSRMTMSSSSSEACADDCCDFDSCCCCCFCWYCFSRSSRCLAIRRSWTFCACFWISINWVTLFTDPLLLLLLLAGDWNRKVLFLVIIFEYSCLYLKVKHN